MILLSRAGQDRGREEVEVAPELEGECVMLGKQIDRFCIDCPACLQ